MYVKVGAIESMKIEYTKCHAFFTSWLHTMYAEVGSIDSMKLEYTQFHALNQIHTHHAGSTMYVKVRAIYSMKFEYALFHAGFPVNYTQCMQKWEQ